ncbi:MAG: hypothetical protein HOV77_05830 [Hamadaea sp.]|uniref:hypothetical protein n=1 Tax=Hamadaea sp. TaxID=2024425 RepID=UPI0017A1F24B|nr:hypothetical protein [Hamadaea sp.]NUT18684.1 hypothetical protein [Hamadaea sp.]
MGSTRQRTVRLTLAAALATAASAVFIAAPAHAALRDYLCDTVTVLGSTGTGAGNCVPLNGAPAVGTVAGEFTVHGRDTEKFFCGTPESLLSGIALTPVSVTCLERQT